MDGNNIDHPADVWKERLHHIYDFHYRGYGGQQALSKDLGVSRCTIIYWLTGKPNPCTGRPIAPNYNNRIAIDGLWARTEISD